MRASERLFMRQLSAGHERRRYHEVTSTYHPAADREVHYRPGLEHFGSHVVQDFDNSHLELY
jgi:hypothetical protein